MASFTMRQDSQCDRSSALIRYRAIERANGARLYGMFVRSLLEALPALGVRALPVAITAPGVLLRAALDAPGRRDGIAPPLPVWPCSAPGS